MVFIDGGCYITKLEKPFKGSLVKICFQCGLSVFQFIKADTPLFFEESNNLISGELLGVGADSDKKASGTAIGFFFALGYIYSENVIYCLDFYCEVGFQLAGHILHSGTGGIVCGNSLKLTGVRNSQKYGAAAGIGKGTDFLYESFVQRLF